MRTGEGKGDERALDCKFSDKFVNKTAIKIIKSNIGQFCPRNPDFGQKFEQPPPPLNFQLCASVTGYSSGSGSSLGSAWPQERLHSQQQQQQRQQQQHHQQHQQQQQHQQRLDSGPRRFSFRHPFRYRDFGSRNGFSNPDFGDDDFPVPVSVVSDLRDLGGYHRRQDRVERFHFENSPKTTVRQVT
jgi:hypothetical protein